MISLQDQLSGRNHGPRKGSLDATLLLLCIKLMFIAPQYLDLFLLVWKGRVGTLQAGEISNSYTAYTSCFSACWKIIVWSLRVALVICSVAYPHNQRILRFLCVVCFFVQKLDFENQHPHAAHKMAIDTRNSTCKPLTYGCLSFHPYLRDSEFYTMALAPAVHSGSFAEFGKNLKRRLTRRFIDWHFRRPNVTRGAPALRQGRWEVIQASRDEAGHEQALGGRRTRYGPPLVLPR